jgi:hypothetical protein
VLQLGNHEPPGKIIEPEAAGWFMVLATVVRPYPPFSSDYGSMTSLLARDVSVGNSLPIACCVNAPKMTIKIRK